MPKRETLKQTIITKCVVHKQSVFQFFKALPHRETVPTALIFVGTLGVMVANETKQDAPVSVRSYFQNKPMVW